MTPRRAWTVDLDGLDGLLRAATPVATPAPPREVFLLPPAPALVHAALPAPDADPFNESPTAVDIPAAASVDFNESPTSIEIAAATPPRTPPAAATPVAAEPPAPSSGAGWVLPVAGLAMAAVVLGALAVGAWWAFRGGEPAAAPAPLIAAAPEAPAPPIAAPASVSAVVAPPAPPVPAPAAAPVVAPPAHPASPPAAVPAAPQAAPAPAPTGQRWTVHFNRDGVDPAETRVPAWVSRCPRLGIVGHTDAAGDAHVNDIIGLGRAIATRRLVGDDAARAGDSVRSAGADEPAGDNSTAAGRRANRRAVVTCLTP